MGQLGGFGTNLWSNVEEVFIVNGYVNKGDGNFEGPFIIKNIEGTGGTNISLGNYPMNDQDYARIKQEGCTAVLDIQNTYRSVDIGAEQQQLRKYGISNYKNVPIWDCSEEEYASTLFKAAVELDNMINK